jgi:hypothetical protein
MASRRIRRHVPEQVVPAADAAATPSDGVITSAMMRRAEKLRAEQRVPFPEDSADLIRESRIQRRV